MAKRKPQTNGLLEGGNADYWYDDPLCNALVDAASIRAASEQVGVPYATARERVRLPAFQEALLRLRRERMNAVRATYRRAVQQAADGLVSMSVKSTDERIRFNAILEVIDRFEAAHHDEAFEDRLVKVEQLLLDLKSARDKPAVVQGTMTVLPEGKTT